MKIKRLIIHNIASYENADIDFEQKPLSDADVFLISGITGSGKSTILDAICMALYGKTPRIEESDTTTVAAINRPEGITLTDPRRFLRRNTGEGFVELYFEASGINFKAHWGVKRAYNKPTGALQPREWTLTNLDTKHTLTYESEIKERIGELVGLDYDQFCRTTMLSQGEFDKFLKSKESEKAEILQKITGADIYQRIGQQIFARTAALKSEYQKLQEKLDNTKVLTADEIEQLKQQIADKAREVESISAKIKQQTADRAWLEARDLNAKNVAQLTEALERAIAETQTDDFRAAQTDISQFDSTGDARNALRQISAQRNAIAAAAATIENLRSRYASLLADVKLLDDAVVAAQNQLNDANEKLLAEQPRKPIYDAAGEICTMLNKAVDDERSAKSNREQSVKLGKEHDKAKELYSKNEKKRESLQNALDEQQKLLDEQQEKIAELNVASLRMSKDNMQTQLRNIDNAVSAIKLHAANEKALHDLTTALLEAENKKADLDEMAEKAVANLQAKQEVLKSAEDTRDKQRAAAGESAAVLRRGLKSGDICPVCGQAVGDVLPIADILEAMLNTADKAYDAAYAAVMQATADVESVKSQKKLNEEFLANNRKSQPELAATAQKSLTAAMTACQACGQKFVGVDKTVSELVILKVTTERTFNELSDSIKQIDAQQAEIDKQRKELDKNKADIAKFDEQLATAKEQLHSLKNDVEKAVALADQLQQSAADAREQAVGKLDSSVAWDNDPIASTAQFVKELTDKKNAYTKLADKIVKLSTDVQTKAIEADAAHKAAARVAATVAEWNEVQPAAASNVDDVAEALNTVAAEVKSAADSVVTANVALAKSQGELNIFVEEHPEISANRLTHLAALTDNEVLQLRKKLEALTGEVNKGRGALEQAKQTEAEHLLKQPETFYESPDLTVDMINAAIATLEQNRTDLTQQSGAITEKLKANDAEVEKRRADQEACDKAKAVYDNWNGLNTLLGDKEGKRFRTIALSYVLNSLIRSANVYMSRLTDRYTLSVQPGTFIILVTDAYQGYTTRTANTISGGETFLVSLALALALSDLGSVSGIDILFIDEGFGSLSGEPLQNAIETLRILHSNNRRVGIISHVAELRERIPVQIQVTQSDRTAASNITIVG